MPHHFLHILGIALLWGAGGSAVAWVLTWPVRRRGWTGGHVSIAVVATFATVAAIAGNARAMLISTDDGHATIVSAVIAGLLASVAALLSARTFRRDSAFLHTDIAHINSGGVPTQNTEPMSPELRGLHHAMREMGANLADARKREYALEASRRELVAWISDDLRTPLTGLRAAAGELGDDIGGDHARRHDRITAEVQQLTEMVDDLYELSRLHVGMGKRRNERVDLSALLSTTMSNLERVAHAEKVRLTGSAAVAAEVMGDPGQLNRALTNLVYNAIRHTPARGAVTVELRAGERPGQALLRVTDRCGGFAPGDVPRLRDIGLHGDPLDDAPSGETAGGGLGLTVTREIVDAHDGAVEFENTDDGCAFTIVLPLAS
ncbi:sensor histidine kinase KdpD [Allobranchiibius sp. GilTou73]|uniref:sensor histidine kinase n=1 Tax=Allobranchiibius sp. GilTou73 TaxID=2904523 RepID=UPI001F1EA209|nr:HAMP domain-containing sensor histidine kinase [Allobranchiibius sp. GilTou73]UIJ36084.1 HAMP domain-containing histidine kinase [Allobranchiibius sp. GilTou73]